jgi:predicted O-methyltransferase YrrM
LRLPIVGQAQLDVRPIDWTGLPRRFMNPGELEVLVALARQVAPTAVVEIGVNQGRTALALLDNVPSIVRYYGVDVPPGTMLPLPVQAKEVPARAGELAVHDPRFRLILRTRGSLDLTPADDDLPRPADFVFIDGDHSRAAVEHDSRLARTLCRPGGIIVWHDYHDLGTVDVCEVLEELAAAGAPIAAIAGTWLAFMRV